MQRVLGIKIRLRDDEIGGSGHSEIEREEWSKSRLYTLVPSGVPEQD